MLCNRCWGETWNYAGTDVWETDLFIDIHFFCLSPAHTQTQAHNPHCRPLLLLFLLFHWPTSRHWGWGDELVGWMRSGSSISLYPCLPPSPPSSLRFCSAALQTLQTQSGEQAPLSAAGLLVCEYANAAFVYVLASWVSSGRVWIRRHVNMWVCGRAHTMLRVW